jgi:hypothetical protein
MEAQMLRLLLLVVVLFVLTGAPGRLLIVAIFNFNADRPHRGAWSDANSNISGSFQAAGNLTLVTIIYSPALWVACIWVPTLFSPPKNTPGGDEGQTTITTATTTSGGGGRFNTGLLQQVQLSSSESGWGGVRDSVNSVDLN